MSPGNMMTEICNGLQSTLAIFHAMERTPDYTQVKNVL
uniref:Uncharacterized protein n=1 Tax=Anguilla anguilla TaxID=7936 RepID=A0A0E9VN42_ANGAN